ncbi:WD-40 repeat-containing protein [Calothrix sp. NIES-4071]|nr:WD-40 repeat-containing protein [Calothrix sp. NIES-4071]BAZ59508.1 WD-40 repeat-containing protein [Calothrix sp. NIES-4105]
MLEENKVLIESIKKLLSAYARGERDFARINLENADLSKLDLSGINLSNANLRKAKLVGAKLSNANLSQANLEKADLQHADLSQANLNQVNLEEAKLDGANLNAANLTAANLNYAYMPRVQLSKANLQEAGLKRAELTGANLEESTLDKVNFFDARLRKANLKKASFKQAYLHECKLQFSDLTDANLQKADLSKAELNGAILTQTDLRGAEIAEAKQANIESAILGKLEHQIIKHSLHLEFKDALGESIAFSPNGNIFAYYNNYRKIILIDSDSKREVNKINIQTEPVVSVAFGADGQTIYKSFYVNELKLWNPLTGDLISNLKNHSANSTSIVLDANGKGLEMIGTGEPFELHDIGHETRTFKGYSTGIQTQANSPDGYFIARSAPDIDGQIELIDKQTGNKIYLFSGHQAAVQSLSFSPNSKLLASRSAKDFKIWDIETQKQIFGYSQPFSSHYSHVAFTYGDKRSNPILITSEFWGKFESRKFYSSSTKADKYHLHGGGSSYNSEMIISTDRKVFARRFDEDPVQLWDLQTKQELTFLKVDSKYGKLMALSSQGAILVTRTKQEIILWNVETKNLVFSLTGHIDYANAIAFSPDDKILASGGSDLMLKLWNVQEGNEIKTLLVPATITALAFNPQEPILASGHGDGIIKLWDLNTMEEIHSFKAHKEEVEALTFSSDGKLLASSEGNRGSIIRLWKLKYNQISTIKNV